MATKNKLKELVGRNIGAVKPTQPNIKGSESVETTPITRPSVEIGTKEGDTRATFKTTLQSGRRFTVKSRSYNVYK